MFKRHLIFRSRQLFILFALMFLLITTVIGSSQLAHHSLAADHNEAPINVAGWSDPVGG